MSTEIFETHTQNLQSQNYKYKLRKSSKTNVLSSVFQTKNTLPVASL